MARTKQRGRKLPKGFQIPKEEYEKMTPEERKAFINEAKKSHGKKMQEQRIAAKKETTVTAEKADAPVKESSEVSPEA